jgi:hypothetical protein
MVGMNRIRTGALDNHASTQWFAALFAQGQEWTQRPCNTIDKHETAGKKHTKKARDTNNASAGPPLCCTTLWFIPLMDSWERPTTICPIHLQASIDLWGGGQMMN